MQKNVDRYTKLVSWAKIILPIVALGILSTLFLLSRSVDPSATIPFSESDVAQRTKGQQISAPEVFGVSGRGDFISLKAEFARQTPDAKAMESRDVSARIKLTSGVVIDLGAKHARQEITTAIATLSGDVTAKTTSGYTFNADTITMSLDDLFAQSAGPVTGTGPEGVISAGQMLIEVPQGEKEAHIVLKNGVKLVYTPQAAKD